jgi:hypothetical protein
MVRATSAADYIRKIKSVKFPGSDDDFEPSALNFNLLFDRATIYSHQFSRVLQMITERAINRDIPPLYKQGKTFGIIDYFLAAWPHNSGNLLYSKLSIKHTSLMKMSDFPSFLYKFLKVLKPYKKLREGILCLDYILNVKDNSSNYQKMKQLEHRPIEPVVSHMKIQSQEQNLTFDPTYEDIYEDKEIEFDQQENPLVYDPEDSHEPERSRESVPNALVLKQKKESGTPCKKMYEYGVCKDNQCTSLHDRDSMTNFQDRILSNLIKSQFADPEDIFVAKVSKLFAFKKNRNMYQA